jgi:dihydrofolate reductase
MARLIVQMQMSADGFVSASDPEVDWQVWSWGPEWTWDADLKKDFNTVFASIGTILLSRQMVNEGYLDHWGRTAAAHPGDPDYAFARKVVEVPKLIVSRDSDLATELKAIDGDIICFGGANFVRALVAQGLVDELQLFVNPAVLGGGASIFDSPQVLSLAGSKAYECGIVVSRYRLR